MDKKPCIQCEELCEILPVQLGDSFTLAYLRVCSADCMFGIAYDYLYSIGYHRHFRRMLDDRQDPDDRRMRDEFIAITTRLFLEDQRGHLESNPDLLSHPMPAEIFKMFAEKPQIPIPSGSFVRCARPCKEDKIQWAKQEVERTMERFRLAKEELEGLEND